MPGILKWDLGDTSTNVNLNSFTHTYNPISYGGIKNVKIYKGTTTSAADVSALDMQLDNLVGDIDISCFIGLRSINLQNNGKLTGVKFPTTSAPIDLLWLAGCDVSGTLDVSGLTGLGGTFQPGGNARMTQILNPVSSRNFTEYNVATANLSTLDLRSLTGLGGVLTFVGNPNLTQILNPVSSRPISHYYSYSDNLTGTLDVSGLTGLGGIFQVYNNPNLTKIINPSSSQTFSSYLAYSCNLTGPLDVSKLTGLGGSFQVYSNPNLTQIVNPISSQIFNTYHAYNCNLTGNLDLSSLTNLGGDFEVQNNTNLTQIVNPTTSQSFSNYLAYSCNLTGTLDVSKLTGLAVGGGSFMVDTNPLLTKIINPTSSGSFWNYTANNCNLIGTLDMSSLTAGISNVILANNPYLTNILMPTLSIPPYSIRGFTAYDCCLGITAVDHIFQKYYDCFVKQSPNFDFGIYMNNNAGGSNSWPTDSWDNRYVCGLQNIFEGSTAYDVSVHIRIESGPSSINALNFDGDTAVYLGTNDRFDISTAWSSPITFSMVLDVSKYSGSYYPVLFYLNSSTGNTFNRCYVYVQNTNLFCVQFGSGSPNASENGYYTLFNDISIGSVVNVEIYYTPGVKNMHLNYVRFNGVAKTPTWDLGGHGYIVLGDFADSYVGAHGSLNTFFMLRNATVWNVKVTRENKWKGWPDGSLNSSWTDRIGSYDGSIIRTAAGQATTRTITL